MRGRSWHERRVNEGRAHAALVFDGDLAVAWCQYGTPDELPNIYHRKGKNHCVMTKTVAPAR
jgi:hypothetical protein